MAIIRVQLTFPQESVKRPVIYEIGKEFDVVTNVRRANVTATSGWVVLELSGEREEIERALEGFKSRGVRVDPVEGDVVSP
ncbi:MAG: NIL domain-containing protein [Nitrospinae bacterium]|nr:NIL domain-containing protein [Nitrospinota bacterium]MCH7767530.1 NIL domain-containing protein [Nitrospinota bacterium]